jgi:hypothetical protein
MIMLLNNYNFTTYFQRTFLFISLLFFLLPIQFWFKAKIMSFSTYFFFKLK